MSHNFILQPNVKQKSRTRDFSVERNYSEPAHFKKSGMYFEKKKYVKGKQIPVLQASNYFPA